VVTKATGHPDGCKERISASRPAIPPKKLREESSKKFWPNEEQAGVRERAATPRETIRREDFTANHLLSRNFMGLLLAALIGREARHMRKN
jgi:hypothetical protein